MFFQDRDPYVILGVSPTAGQGSIKAAYRLLARRYHPDLATSPEARRRMIEINRAWEVLGDPARRAQHDRSRSQGVAAVAAAEAARKTGQAGREAAFRTGWMARHATGRQPSQGWGAGAKGRPPGNPSGSVLAFGIYLGWSLGEIARVDPLYLDWLADRPEGRRYCDEIAALRGRPPATSSRGWGA